MATRLARSLNTGLGVAHPLCSEPPQHSPPSLPQDLVAWITVGFLHIPHSEDIPNTATPGNSVGFLLRPFNFFPEDPALASRDLVVVWPLENGSTYAQRWIPEENQGCLKPPPFSYNGSYRPV